jgi:hypothetical protein
MIYLLTAIGLTPGSSSTVHIYTQTIHRTTQSKQRIHRTTQFTNRKSADCAPSLGDVYPGICLTTEKKHGKTSVRIAGECQLARKYRTEHTSQ